MAVGTCSGMAMHTEQVRVFLITRNHQVQTMVPRSPGHCGTKDAQVAKRGDDKRQQRARQGADEADESAKAGHEHCRQRRAQHDGRAGAAEGAPLGLVREALQEPALG